MLELLNVPFFGLPWTVYQMCFIFLFYSVLGWAVETCYMAIQLGEFENRGFLNGPFCPIYGLGVILVIILLTPIQKSLLVLMIGSTVLCTSWELAVGVAMKKIFHNIWWDYSMEKFNFHGYICLKISLCWGGACVLMMRILQPMLMRVVNLVPPKFGHVFIYLCFMLIAFDLVISLCAVSKLNSRLRQLDEVAKKLRFASEGIGGNLAEEALELKARYDRLLEKKNLMQERLIRAFPTMRSERYSISLETLKEKLRSRIQLK